MTARFRQPAMNGLIAFEVAARTGSFTRAARGSGAQTPEEIALSLLAALVAVQRVRVPVRPQAVVVSAALAAALATPVKKSCCGG